METQMKVNGHLPDHVQLERRLSGILTEDGGTVTAAQLRALMQETEVAIVDAQEMAAVAKSDALDPTVTPNPAEAIAKSEDLALRAGRLHTLLTRLQRLHVEVAEAERLKEWQGQFNELKKQRDALAEELAEVYPATVATLIDLFTRIGALDEKLSALHQARPRGVQLHLLGSELVARELERFTRDVPSLLQAVTLLDFDTGKPVWPLVRKRDMSMFDPERYADPRASKDWWKFKEADAAQAKAESQRVADYYEKQNKEREAREKEAGK
jgi:hypothetical protein